MIESQGHQQEWSEAGHGPVRGQASVGRIAPMTCGIYGGPRICVIPAIVAHSHVVLRPVATGVLHCSLLLLRFADPACAVAAVAVAEKTRRTMVQISRRERWKRLALIETLSASWGLMLMQE